MRGSYRSYRIAIGQGRIRATGAYELGAKGLLNRLQRYRKPCLVDSPLRHQLCTGLQIEHFPQHRGRHPDRRRPVSPPVLPPAPRGR